MSQVILALDNMERREILNFAKIFSGKVWGFKVNDALIEYGTAIIPELRQFGYVFADPKLHDIPNTIYNGTTRLVKAGANFITVHASSGKDGVQAAVNATQDKAIILAVTLLTSLAPEDIVSVYKGYPIKRMAGWILETKCPGIVCSAHELPFWEMWPVIKVVPGIRPDGPVMQDDQSRTAPNAETAEFVVLGRVITQSLDPLKALEEFESTKSP